MAASLAASSLKRRCRKTSMAAPDQGVMPTEGKDEVVARDSGREVASLFLAQPWPGASCTGLGSRTRSPARPGLFSENTIPDLGLPPSATPPSRFFAEETSAAARFRSISRATRFRRPTFSAPDPPSAPTLVDLEPRRRTIRGLGVDPRSIRHFLEQTSGRTLQESTRKI